MCTLLHLTKSYLSEVSAPKSDITVSATIKTGILSHNALSCRSNKILLNCTTLLFQRPHKTEPRNNYHCFTSAVDLIQRHRSRINTYTYYDTYILAYKINSRQIIQTNVIRKFLGWANATVCSNITRYLNMLKAMFCWTNRDNANHRYCEPWH
jgi:hypothetical protein